MSSGKSLYRRVADDGLEETSASVCGACRPVASGCIMRPTHLMKTFRDYARTGRASKEALVDFEREGWVDEYDVITDAGSHALKIAEGGGQ